MGDKLASSGLKDWKNAIGAKRRALKSHEKTAYNQDAIIKVSHFLKVQFGEEKISDRNFRTPTRIMSVKKVNFETHHRCHHYTGTAQHTL